MTDKFGFLRDVDALIKLSEEQRELSGENFNIFSIMNMERDEVHTHSAIIGELLNPKGTHGLGSKPLELFIKSTFLDGFEMDCMDAICIKEEYIGPINEEGSEGGRLDIIVKDKHDNVFVIENKIDAPEQKNQLLRYLNRYPKAKLLFLTTTGHDSQQKWEEDLEENSKSQRKYTTVSYAQLLPWIEDCAILAFEKPMVREVLNQYKFLIKKIINVTTDNVMQQKIIEIIEKNPQASAEIARNFDFAVKELQLKFIKKISADLSVKWPKLQIEIGEFKFDKSIIIKGLPEEYTVKFRIKRQQQPVITIHKDENIASDKAIPYNFMKNDGYSIAKVGNVNNDRDELWKIIKKRYFGNLLTPTDSDSEVFIGEIEKAIKGIELKVKPRILYIHGFGSDKRSRKYLDLQEHFGEHYRFDCMEWKNEDDIASKIDEYVQKLQDEEHPIIIGDSTGANFAVQLQDKLRGLGREATLILTSPLLNISDRISNTSFPPNLVKFIKPIIELEHSLMILSSADKTVSQVQNISMFDSSNKILDVEDDHRLQNFKEYLPEISKFIKNTRLLSSQ